MARRCKFLIVDAVWTGTTAPLPAETVGVAGRRLLGVRAERINFFMYGFYPASERWRVNLFFALRRDRLVCAACSARAA